MLMTALTPPMRHPGVLTTCNDAHKTNMLCYRKTLQGKQTQSRQLESNLVRPFIQNFSLETRNAAGSKPRNSAVKQEGQNLPSIGPLLEFDDANWSAMPSPDGTLRIMIGHLSEWWAGVIAPSSSPICSRRPFFHKRSGAVGGAEYCGSRAKARKETKACKVAVRLGRLAGEGEQRKERIPA